MKRLASILCLLLCLSMAACAPATEAAPEPTLAPTPESTAEPTPEPTPEPVTATAEAYGFGGMVSVTLTVQDGVVIDAVASGDGETESLGGVAIKEMPIYMKLTGSISVDTIAGATITSNALSDAAKKAYAMCMGE